MDRTTLSTLKRMIRPVSLCGALTAERAASVVGLNFEIARFHATVIRAERILDETGALETRLERELVGQALHLTRLQTELDRTGVLPPALRTAGIDDVTALDP